MIRRAAAFALPALAGVVIGIGAGAAYHYHRGSVLPVGYVVGVVAGAVLGRLVYWAATRRPRQ